MYRYKLFIETGMVGDSAYDTIIESETPLSEEELQDEAEQHFFNTCSYGGYRINEDDEYIDMDAIEEEEDKEEDEEDED